MTLTPEVRSFLEDVRFAVLATHHSNNRIHQSVMWYELRGDTIMMNTVAGRVKSRNLRKYPQVSVCWEDDYSYVAIQGEVIEIIDDHETAVADIQNLARRYHSDKSEEELAPQLENFATQQRETVLISIDHVFTKDLG